MTKRLVFQDFVPFNTQKSSDDKLEILYTSRKPGNYLEPKSGETIFDQVFDGTVKEWYDLFGSFLCSSIPDVEGVEYDFYISPEILTVLECSSFYWPTYVNEKNQSAFNEYDVFGALNLRKKEYRIAVNAYHPTNLVYLVNRETQQILKKIVVKM
jgi:hypothetical protein